MHPHCHSLPLATVCGAIIRATRRGRKQGTRSRNLFLQRCSRGCSPGEAQEKLADPQSAILVKIHRISAFELPWRSTQSVANHSNMRKAPIPCLRYPHGTPEVSWSGHLGKSKPFSFSLVPPAFSQRHRWCDTGSCLRVCVGPSDDQASPSGRTR